MSELAEALKARMEDDGHLQMEEIHEALAELKLEIRAEQNGVAGTRLYIAPIGS